MADQNMKVRCPNPDTFATFTRDIPTECLNQMLTQRFGVADVGTRLAHWAMDKYHSVSPETKAMAKEVVVRAVQRSFPFVSLFIDYFKK